MLDAQLSQVHVYVPDGTHLRTLFGEGEGPGKVRGPRDLVLLEDGRVGVAQEVPGRLIFVTRNNVPAGTMAVGGEGMQMGGAGQLFSLFGHGEVLLAAGFMQSRSEEPGKLKQVSFLSRLNPDGTEPVISYLQRGVRVHEDGSVWVLTTRGMRGQPEGVMATFDVFTPEGRGTPRETASSSSAAIMRWSSPGSSTRRWCSSPGGI